jgi:SLIDE
MLGLSQVLSGHSTARHGGISNRQRKQTVVHVLSRYGAWDELKAQIRQSWRFRFDWFFKSRTPQVHTVTL